MGIDEDQDIVDEKTEKNGRCFWPLVSNEIIDEGKIEIIIV